MSIKKTHIEFIEEINKIHGDNIVIMSQYTGNKNKVLVKYKDCKHQEYKIPSKLLAGQGCGNHKCKNDKLSKVKLAKGSYDKAFKKFNIDYIECLEKEYLGIKSDIKVLNKKCNHVYTANLGNICSGSGCPVCHGMKDTTIFKKQIEEKYPNEYTILGEYVNNRVKILVRHNKCGTEWEVIPKDLLRDRRCPQCIKSKGELFVQRYLEINKIEYVSQYGFNNCKDKRQLPFDFAIIQDDKIKLIEFDGLQHFNKGNFWGDDSQRELITIHDNIKTNYCFKNDIPLLRIPYWWIRNDRAIKELDKFILNK